MKNTYLDQLPKAITDEIGAARFILMTNDLFPQLVAFGDDPVTVLRGNKPVVDGAPTEANTSNQIIPGTTLYRVDSRGV